MAEIARLEDRIEIPAELFDALTSAEDLAELKVILHVLKLSSAAGQRAIEADALLAPSIVRSVAGPTSPEPGERRVRRAVDRAVANGSLIRITAAVRGVKSVYILPGTRQARRLVDRLQAAEPSAAQELDLPPDVRIEVYRPNLFAVYERHIGPLTPIVAEQLRDAERSYPHAWIEGAIMTAVDYNRRNWRYIETILARWEEVGAPHGIARRRPETN